MSQIAPLESSRRQRSHSWAFKPERGSLTSTNTHGDKGPLAAAASQLLQRGENKTRATGPHRMTERDRATIDIKFFVWNFPDADRFQLAQNGDYLRGEGLVDLDKNGVV